VTAGGREPAARTLREDEMNLDFSEEQIALREMVRGLCAEHTPTAVVRRMEDDPKGYADEFWKQQGQLGLLGLLIPEQYGGSGQSLLEAALVYEEFGRALAPSPHFPSAVLGAGAILAAGSQKQKQEWLPKLASGEAILTPAWLEPRRGFAGGVQLRAGAQVLRTGETCPSRLLDPLFVLAHGPRPADPAFPGRPRRGRLLSRSGVWPRRGRAPRGGVPAGDRIGAALPGDLDGVMHDAIVLLAAWRSARRARPESR
jgi:hypothetical protein